MEVEVVVGEGRDAVWFVQRAASDLVILEVRRITRAKLNFLHLM
jgi:hypothetical protein